MLASSAMNGAVFESTINIFFKLKYGKIYDAILSTPMKTTDIAIGEIVWSLGRGLIYSAAFLLVMAVMGLIESPWGILALPASLLIGFAFAACGMAATTYMNSWQDFDMVNLVVLPLFLFSATFYPLDVYPDVFQVLTQLSPLYHGVQMIRALTLGYFDVNLFGHVAYLLTMGAIGATIASRRLEKLLLS
jgi:lipooligosaccharide transport system permease protein